MLGAEPGRASASSPSCIPRAFVTRVDERIVEAYCSADVVRWDPRWEGAIPHVMQ